MGSETSNSISSRSGSHWKISPDFPPRMPDFHHKTHTQRPLVRNHFAIPSSRFIMSSSVMSMQTRPLSGLNRQVWSRLRISNRFRRSLPAQHMSCCSKRATARCRASDDSKSGGSDSSSGSGGDDAAGDSGGDEPNNEPISLESIFAEEMKRRQSGGARVGGGVAPEEQFDWVKTREKRESEAKFKDERMSRDQLKASRELQSEGLEGLPDRAKQLLTLGGLSFVPFLPFIVVGALVFATTWVYFGDAFVHGGDNAIDYGLPDSETPAQLSRPADTRKAGAPPPYVPPEVLLAEPSADGPMVNFKENRP